MMGTMTQKAVIDIGSLKLKLAIFDTVKRELLQSNSYLTLMGKGIHDTGEIDSESLTKLAVALEDIAKRFKQQEITDVAIIGTEALRRAKNIGTVERLIDKHFSGHTLEVVDQDKEAEIFFKAVSREFPDQKIMVMDIGGGSVQLIEGAYDARLNSYTIDTRYNLPTGTYKLQQLYSPDSNSLVTNQGFAKAQNYVTNAYAEVNSQSPILIFGSTCMHDFAVSAGLVMVKSSHSTLHPISVEVNSLRTLLSELTNLAPNKRTHYFPEGGHFMYGADYMLVNLLQAIKHVKPREVIPTNLNSSYAFI